MEFKFTISFTIHFCSTEPRNQFPYLSRLLAFIKPRTNLALNTKTWMSFQKFWFQWIFNFSFTIFQPWQLKNIPGISGNDYKIIKFSDSKTYGSGLLMPQFAPSFVASESDFPHKSVNESPEKENRVKIFVKRWIRRIEMWKKRKKLSKLWHILKTFWKMNVQKKEENTFIYYLIFVFLETKFY